MKTKEELELDLVVGFTKLISEAATYLERMNNPQLTLPLGPIADGKPTDITATTVKPPKEKKPKAPKAEPAPAPGFPPEQTEAVKTPPAVKELSETESSAEALKVAKEFVQRFQKSTPDGLTRAKAILAEYKVAKIGDLVHADRLTFIKRLQDGLTEAA